MAVTRLKRKSKAKQDPGEGKTAEYSEAEQ